MKKECIIIIDLQKYFTSVDGNYAKRHPGILQILEAKKRVTNCNNKCEIIDSPFFLIPSPK